MTDELTPEEKEALKNLPRERMPVGLESRVVEAMRERRFLAKPRRTMVITNGRVAGLIAASLALIVTAYSIGLYRGAGEPLIPPMATGQGIPEPEHQDDRRVHDRVGDEEARADGIDPDRDAPARRASEKDGQDKKSARGATGEPVVAEKIVSAPSSRAGEVALKAEPEAPAASDALSPRTQPPREAEAGRTLEAGPETRRARQDIATGREQLESTDSAPPKEERVGASEKTPAAVGREGVSPQAMYQESVRLAAPSRAGKARVMSREPLTYRVDGTTFVVEAPDSVRVTQDEQGRTLLIYTSDGIIRIRLADEN